MNHLHRRMGGLAEIISVATLISYLTGPVTVMALRKTGNGCVFACDDDDFLSRQ